MSKGSHQVHRRHRPSQGGPQGGVRRLFRACEAADESDEDTKAVKADLISKIVEALTVHAYVENEVMYPTVRELVPDLESDILESYEEHHVADLLCAELDAMDPDDERFDAKTAVLIESVGHHIDNQLSGNRLGRW
nr:hemerythrin domain-containing protein [Streptomyces sp. CB03911]